MQKSRSKLQASCVQAVNTRFSMDRARGEEEQEWRKGAEAERRVTSLHSILACLLPAWI